MQIGHSIKAEFSTVGNIVENAEGVVNILVLVYGNFKIATKTPRLFFVT